MPSLIEGVYPNPAGIDGSNNGNNPMMEIHNINSVLSRSGSLSSIHSNVSLPSMASMAGAGALPTAGAPLHKRGLSGSSFSDFQFVSTSLTANMDSSPGACASNSRTHI